jgi:hypothetical protein
MRLMLPSERSPLTTQPIRSSRNGLAAAGAVARAFARKSRAKTCANWLMLAAGLWLAACSSPSTTAPNTAPLELGMTPDAASVALGVPLEPVAGAPGSEVYFAKLAAGTPGYPVDGLLYLQFRSGRLTGWKRDWHIGPNGGPQ